MSTVSFRDAIADLKTYVGERCDRIESHFDTHVVENHTSFTALISSVTPLVASQADHAARLTNLEQTRNLAQTVRINDDAAPFMTKHDVKFVSGLVLGVGALVEILHRAADFLLHLHGGS